MTEQAKTLYDKTGAAFMVDHEHDGFVYVRPMMTVVMQSTNYSGDDFHEEETTEPARFILEKSRDELFESPPVIAINADIATRKSELDALKAEAKNAVREINGERSRAEQKLREAQRQLDEWMKTHRVMMELGKLLDGQVLYPLSVKENSYHHSREIPRIPDMRNAGYLTVTSGDFEKGQKWVCKRYSSDSYGSPFRFYDTEEERAAVIHAEFVEACEAFRKAPNFDTTSYTTGTTLHYGTLVAWVRTHPSLAIPDDINAMKAAHDADLVEQRKAKLAAELAEMEAGGSHA